MTQLILREYTDGDIPELDSLVPWGLADQNKYERWVGLYKNVT